MSKHTLCSIQLLNKTYKIKCPEAEADNLHRAADRLNAHLIEKKGQFKTLDDYQCLLMAALHVSHELVLCQQQQTQHHEQLSQLMSGFQPQTAADKPTS
jgi:cell division protein ZapA